MANEIIESISCKNDVVWEELIRVFDIYYSTIFFDSSFSKSFIKIERRYDSEGNIKSKQRKHNFVIKSKNKGDIEVREYLPLCNPSFSINNINYENEPYIVQKSNRIVYRDEKARLLIFGDLMNEIKNIQINNASLKFFYMLYTIDVINIVSESKKSALIIMYEYFRSYYKDKPRIQKSDVYDFLKDNFSNNIVYFLKNVKLEKIIKAKEIINLRVTVSNFVSENNELKNHFDDFILRSILNQVAYTNKEFAYTQAKKIIENKFQKETSKKIIKIFLKFYNSEFQTGILKNYSIFDLLICITIRVIKPRSQQSLDSIFKSFISYPLYSSNILSVNNGFLYFYNVYFLFYFNLISKTSSANNLKIRNKKNMNKFLNCRFNENCNQHSVKSKISNTCLIFNEKDLILCAKKDEINNKRNLLFSRFRLDMLKCNSVNTNIVSKIMQ